MIYRKACRALLLSDPGALLLLINTRIPDSNTHVWLAPGGGIETGETCEDCVRREVHEETGLSVVGCEGPAWTRRHQFMLLGEQYDQHEEFYVVRTPHFEPEGRNNPALHERDLFVGFKWWSIAEMQRSEDTFVPRRMAHHFQRLLRAGCPSTPIDVGV